ncbi:hypothetical protein BDY19DRAFT_402627 [Irpex rosettiformis]|uniref:Uncharacterized protein n=1 Tax=Irpex rosettiformis TaxID=378272 RepID=A0ACB8UFH7_9APHY|nr:hypothetical protein BDY19DRAFT_402627 [Irpex rosettiformis]
MSDYFDFEFIDGSDSSELIPESAFLEGGDFQFLDLDPATCQIGTLSEQSGTLDPTPHELIQATVQISDTFNLNTNHDSIPPNTIILSIDNTVFAVHHHRLLACSINNFGGYLQSNNLPSRENFISFLVSEPSDVLNVLLHTIYNIPCDVYSPSLSSISSSLSTFDKYGLVPFERFLSKGTPLFTTILNRAVVDPIETYALAASYALEDLAVAASAYTLHVKLHTLCPDIVDKMGTRYMQRLYNLHGSRMDKLRELLDRKLYPHVATPTCSVEKRQVVSRALNLAGKQVMYDASPAMTRSGIENVMRGVADSVACADCREAAHKHIKEISTQWMIFERTI